MRHVARAANVSVATVSRVLNTPHKVSTETLTRVEQKIAELRFVPSAAARAINSGRSKILGALIPTLDSDIFSQTITAIERRLADYGFSLVVATTEDDRDLELRKASALLNIGVEGLFLSGVTHNDDLHALLDRTSVPAVAISYFNPAYHIPTIGYDNFEAARSACAHLVELGHRNIVFVHGPTENNDRTRARVAGVTSLASGLELSCVETELSVPGGSVAALQILQRPALPSAILCASDFLAYGVLHELHRAGVAVPEQVSVMGIHDLPGSEVVVPRLTTVRLPVQDMGSKAADALASWVVDQSRPTAISLATEVVVRESTRRLRP